MQGECLDSSVHSVAKPHSAPQDSPAECGNWCHAGLVRRCPSNDARAKNVLLKTKMVEIAVDAQSVGFESDAGEIPWARLGFPSKPPCLGESSIPVDHDGGRVGLQGVCCFQVLFQCRTDSCGCRRVPSIRRKILLAEQCRNVEVTEPHGSLPDEAAGLKMPASFGTGSRPATFRTGRQLFQCKAPDEGARGRTQSTSQNGAVANDAAEGNVQRMLRMFTNGNILLVGCCPAFRTMEHASSAKGKM
ncbi:hypothetical protein TRVL_10312 [Trypanosoma vivax]|nr:hypothetical protein TRVL_10312 [Trypanosoma vivax]